ncbi:tyrosine-type recombinase/integrase [Duncaniella sp. C9]|uniref:tyrosine-type recombinase/integrase n=1 Tax=Duncaniella sp. C9 TaxID=2530392 RepID=UPI003518FD1C
MTQPAIAKRLHKYAAVANGECPEVPLNLHAHQIRHAKASHWLEDGMNIVQISFLLGHADVKTTMFILILQPSRKKRLLPQLRTKKTEKYLKNGRRLLNLLLNSAVSVS